MHVPIPACRSPDELAELTDRHVQATFTDVVDLALHDLGPRLENHHDRVRRSRT